MRYLSLFLILLIPTSVFSSDYLRCYSGGTFLYSGHVDQSSYEDGLFTVIERDTGKMVLIKGDCVIKIDA